MAQGLLSDMSASLVQELISLLGTSNVLHRPEDLILAEGPNVLQATVTAAEYAGREFITTATTPDGATITFLAPQALPTDAAVRLSVTADRVRVFPTAQS